MDVNNNGRHNGVHDILRIGEHIAAIQEARDKIMPVIMLMCSTAGLNPDMGEVLTKEQLGNLGILLKGLLDEVFSAVDGIDNIYRRSICI